MRTLPEVPPNNNLVGRTFQCLKAVSLKCCIACLLYLGPMTARAQSPTFYSEHWTARDGLPDSTITSLAQTQDGALWVGTIYGLARFDGAQFAVSTPKNLPGLRSSTIENMAAGPDSDLYIGTNSGLTVLSRGQARRFQEQGEVKNSRVMIVLPVGAEDAWFGTFSGYLYHYHHDSIEAIRSDAFSHEPIYGLAMAPDGTLWVATGAGLFFLSHGTMNRYKPPIPLPVIPIFDLAVSPHGSIFAASDGGLFEIEGSHWRSWTRRSGLPSNELNVLTIDPQGVLWIGTNSGLARLTAGVVQPIRSVNCSTDSILVDQEKSIWVGCGESKGLIRVSTSLISFLSVPHTTDPAPVSSLVEDRKGVVWMASSRGLFRYQHQRFRLYTRRDGLPNNFVNSVCLSSDGGLWIATNDGLAKLHDGHIQSFRTKEKGRLNPFFSVFEDRHGTLWVTVEQGLRRRRLGQTNFEDVPEVTNTMWSLREDREGAVWIATSHGLLRFAGESKTNFTTACGLGSDRVYDSAQDDTGTIWASTAEGLSRIRNEKCANLGPDNGLSTGKPSSLRFDRRGHIWLRTQDGIAAIDLAEASQVIDRGGSLRNTRYFSRDDGFGDTLVDSPTWNSMLLHSSGALWIPTQAGIAVLNPTALQTPLHQLGPRVTSVVTDLGAHDLARPVKLQPGDLHMQFAFSAPYLLGAKNREYRYRLAGFDQDWRNAGNLREAVYTSLPTGTYHFQVSGRLPFEQWSEPSPPMELIVLPHFYQTWWWYTLLGLTSATAIVLGYQLRLIAVRRQYAVITAERTRERSRLARELHDTLSNGMMAIHLQIQLARALLHSKPDSAYSHLGTAASIARYSASETRRCIAALRSGTDINTTLQDMLNKVVSRFVESSKIPLSATIDDDLPLISEEVSHEIARVAEEALANVRLHSEAEQAYLFARASGKCLRIEVLDNGRGFEMSDPVLASPGHFGLTGMKERAQRIHARLETRSAPGKGTEIVLEVPIDTPGKARQQQF